MIGIFDSGLGGLTVVKEVFKELPEYQILYFGDTARTPYGTKGKKTIIKYTLEDTEFLVKKGAKMIIVACNTASAVASAILKEKFSLPIFEVITPAVQETLKLTKNKRIGVIGTRATIGSRVYEKRLWEADPQLKVFAQACPLLVPLVEEGWLKKPETKRILKKYLAPLKAKNIDTLILGCTHYPLLKDLIRRYIGRRVKLVDSAEVVVGEVKTFLEENPAIAKELKKGQGHQFFVSDLTSKFLEIFQKWLGQRVKAEEVEVG